MDNVSLVVVIDLPLASTILSLFLLMQNSHRSHRSLDDIEPCLHDDVTIAIIKVVCVVVCRERRRKGRSWDLRQSPPTRSPNTPRSAGTPPNWPWWFIAWRSIPHFRGKASPWP